MREYYGYALIAGIPMETARRMLPGYIFDMYKMRCDYDMRMQYGKRIRKRMGL